MTFTVLPAAEVEATEAAIWYDDRQPGLGSRFLDAFAETLDRIRLTPLNLTRLESYTGHHDVRRCMFKRFPYIAIVLVRDDETIVVAVSHVRRRPFYWLERLGRT